MPKPQGNKTQVIIGVVALLVIAIVVVVGFLLNRSNTSTKNEGYGSSKSGTATLANGVITVGTGAATAKPIDFYEDMLCPSCAAFEHQYGQQIAQAIDEGKLTVNYHFMTFLDKSSASGNYSTRAAAALYCTAERLGSVKGLWPALHDTLYSEGVQPSEGASSDLTNDQLVDRIKTAATAAGVAADSPDLAATATCVTGGEKLADVAASYTTSSDTLTKVIGRVQTPVVLSNGAAVDIDKGTWLETVTAG